MCDVMASEKGGTRRPTEATNISMTFLPLHDGATGGEITHRYTDALLGFAAKVPDAAPGTVNALSTLQTNPQLDYLEPDGTVSIQAQAFLNK